MSVFQQFELLLVRRTLQRTVNASIETGRVPSHTLLNFNSLSSCIYENLGETRYNFSPKKSHIEKYKDLKKRLASRGTERPRKLSLRKSTLQEDDAENCQLASNTLLCTKAVVHENQKAQELEWRRTLRQKQEQIV